MLLEQYVEESVHIAVDRGPAFYRPIAPVVHCTRLQGLALHRGGLEFHKVREVPLASSG